MGRGVSSGGGQSSLGYLFGSGESPNAGAPKGGQAPAPAPAPAPVPAPRSNEGKHVSKPAAFKPAATASPPTDSGKQIPAGIHSSSSNNYLRADGQNTGNFITDRPSTKVHAAPGGGSSLDYLFGGAGGK
ncbi:protein SPIRAL1-like 1 [Cucurbita maxima]|uniref:Protein SPIRAL1-like 1 n=1 Tax=Cucurbita maxima TaxID=3661 RepID=A0A6J1KPR8_CUCMA|nr:protein SPIRAL1-like 1 [Cucurbita maxima]